MELEVFGEIKHQLDDKGRVSVSRTLQPLFFTGGFLTRAFNDRSLVFYPLPIWNEFQQRLKEIKRRITEQDPANFLKAELITGNLNRFLSCGTQITALDNQGRLLIPPALREWARLDKEVTLIGLGETIEVWNTEVWRTYNQEQMTIAALEQSMSALSMRAPVTA